MYFNIETVVKFTDNVVYMSARRRCSAGVVCIMTRQQSSRDLAIATTL